MTQRVVLVIDIQNDYFPDGKWPLWNVETASDRALQVVVSARREGLPVIHVRHEFPDPAAPFFVAGTPGAQIHDTLRPLDDEPVVTKHHANSFRDTNLRETLAAQAPADAAPVELVIVGAMSHLCIDATARAAADFGHDVTVVHDACATRDLAFGESVVPAAQVHAAFMAALSTGYARLQSTEEYLAG